MIISVLTGQIVPAYAADVKATVQSAAVSSDSSLSNKDEENVKISRASAKEIAAKFLKEFCDIDVSEKNYEVRASLNQNYNSFSYNLQTQSKVWEFYFSYQDGVKSYNITISVNSDTGNVTRFDNYEYNQRGEELPKVAVINEEQANKIASEFIEKAYPGRLSQLIPENNEINKYVYMNSNTPQYLFRYSRIINGLKFVTDGILIGVDGSTGKVSSLGCNWNDNYTFPDADAKVNSEEAYKALFTEAEMKLNYVNVYNRKNYNQTPSIRLVYIADFKNGNLLDANTGLFTKSQYVREPVLQKIDLSTSEKEGFYKRWRKFSESTQEIDEKKAYEIADEMLNKIFGQKYKLDSINFNDSSNGSMNRKTWSIQFTDNEANSYYGSPTGNITIDATTGQLVNVDLYNNYHLQDNTPFTAKLTWEEAYKKAIDVIAEYYPDKVKDIETQQQYIKAKYIINGKEMPEQYYSFNFTRQVNGIPYLNNSINIGFDIKTGQIKSIRCNWNDNISFPDNQKALSADNAKKEYFNVFSPELVYTLVNKNNDADKPEFEVKLVYILKTDGYPISQYIDAYTGKLFNPLEDTDNNIEEFKKIIKGHWGEKELGILAYQGIIDFTTFNPDKEITRLEAIKILVNAKALNVYYGRNYDDLKFTNIDKENKNYKYLQMAVSYGLIENTKGEFKGDDKITREEMAELLVKLFKYEMLAKSKNIFDLDYKDENEINPDLYGYVAVCTGLNFFVGDNGNFRPKDNTTMAEFAITVYKALDMMKTQNN